jgi:hypothetical protein
VSSPVFLTLALIGLGCVYLSVVVWSFRASGKRDFSTPWLLLTLSGALITGMTLVFSVPAMPAAPVPLRLLELLAHLCNIVLIWAIASRIAPEYRLAGTWLYAWNPLVLIELAVYANTAGVAICLLLLAMVMLLGDVPSAFFARFVSTERRGGSGVDEESRSPRHISLQRESDKEARRRPQGSPLIPTSSPASTKNGPGEPRRSHSRGGGGADVRRGPLRSPSGLKSVGEGTPPYPRPDGIAVLVLVGLALRINFMALLIVPLLLWFMTRHTRGVGAALMGFVWRALVVLAIFIVAYLPGWQGSATFLAITNGLHPFDFANSPLSLIVMPVRWFFGFVAQRGHFPPLMQPTSAADMTVLATSFFLFALLYLREMGQVRARQLGLIAREPSRELRVIEGMGTREGRGKGTRAAQAPPPILPTSPAPTEAFLTRSGRGGGGWEGWWGRLRRPRLGADIAQRDEDKGTKGVTSEESQGDEDKHKAPSPALPRPLSLQDGQDNGGDSDKSHPYDALFTGWVIVVLRYIVLAATVFSPGYIVWGVWVVGLRRFDTLSVCMLLLSCSALLYYPLQQFASTSAGILLPLCVFGIPLVYLIVRRCIPGGRVERKDVLT